MPWKASASGHVEIVAVEISNASRCRGEPPQGHAGERLFSLQPDYGTMRIHRIDGDIRFVQGTDGSGYVALKRCSGPWYLRRRRRRGGG